MVRLKFWADRFFVGLFCVLNGEFKRLRFSITEREQSMSPFPF